MTYHDLVASLARGTDTSQAQVERMLDSLGAHVQLELKHGGEVTIPALGKFYAAQRKARKGRNPRTGESLDIPARRVPDFRPGKALRDAVAL